MGVVAVRFFRRSVSRFYVRPEAVVGDRVIFDAEESRHLARVLRLGPGALITAVDGLGHALTVKLTRVGTRVAEGDILGRDALATESPLDLTLVQSLPKGDKLELIIRMATELGVSRVVPVLSARGIARADDERQAGRLVRWRRVAREAAKQSGRSVIPEVARPLPLREWLTQLPAPGLLVCLWEEARTPAAMVLPDGPVERATLVVGPEGGFTEEEVLGLQSAGAIVAGLGSRILRTETAGPIGIALLQSRYGDLGSVRPAP
jgi:16S rRNA (uracil1498-N3)-methyltransferase